MSGAAVASGRPAPAPAPAESASGGGSASAEQKKLNAEQLREFQQYSATHIQETLQEMMVALFTETPLPAQPLAYMQDFLAAKQSGQAVGGATAQEELMRRLNRAAGQLDAAALAALVESVERQAAAAAPPLGEKPGGGSLPEENEVLVTFTEKGSLGMKLKDHDGTGQPRVVAINAGTQAENYPQLKPGLLITRIGSASVGGMAYKSVLGLLKAAGRPCTIAFLPEKASNPKDDAVALEAAAKAAGQQAAASRAARQGRQRRKGMSIVQGDGGPSQAEMEAALAELN